MAKTVNEIVLRYFTVESIKSCKSEWVREKKDSRREKTARRSRDYAKNIRIF